MQHWARAELPTWFGCQRIGQVGPSPSREAFPWQGVGEVEHCGMVLMGMLKWPRCCHRVLEFSKLGKKERKQEPSQ